jgi:putative transposase
MGSIRRELLNHIIVLNERHLHRLLVSYFSYYHPCRPHLSLERNAPVAREVEPPEKGHVIAIAEVGGLHHRYRRCA